MTEDELFRTRWELLELRWWRSYQPHPTNPEEHGDPIEGWTAKVTPDDRTVGEYMSVAAALSDGWEPVQIDPPVSSSFGQSRTWWFRRSYEDFVFGE